jgi:hypothetical protein
VIDILIPPSIPMILYAVVSGVSIGDLFMAGVLPGILMAAGFVGVCWWKGGASASAGGAAARPAPPRPARDAGPSGADPARGDPLSRSASASPRRPRSR